MRHAMIALILFAACAASPRETETPVQAEPAQPEPAPPATGAPAIENPRRVDAGPAPVPPLSTPNERVDAAAADAAPATEEPDVPHVDPRLNALRRAGEAAQACYDQSGLPPTTAGKLFVRLRLGKNGTVEHAEVVRANSTPALVGGKLEACVVAAMKKQTFPEPRSGADVLVEMPLEFRPVR